MPFCGVVCMHQAIFQHSQALPTYKLVNVRRQMIQSLFRVDRSRVFKTLNPHKAVNSKRCDVACGTYQSIDLTAKGSLIELLVFLLSSALYKWYLGLSTFSSQISHTHLPTLLYQSCQPMYFLYRACEQAVRESNGTVCESLSMQCLSQYL